MGFIIRDKRRPPPLKDLSKGPHSLERLGQKNRLTRQITEKVPEPLLEEGVAKREDNLCSLTEKGKEMAETITRPERPTGTLTHIDGEREGAITRIAPDHKGAQIDTER